jgi:aryl-alcohol dehydrogenase-like predicted oxidoreductase
MKLAIGTAQFGLDYGVANTKGKVSLAEASEIIDLADHLGIRTIDTASAYGNSEDVVGSVSSRNHEIITKLSSVPEQCDDVFNWATAQLFSSISNLKREKIHGILLHRPDQLNYGYGDELYRALHEFKSQGYVSKIGISVYDPRQLDDLWGRYKFDIIQAPLNIIDRRILDSGWAERLKKSGAEVHTRSVFLQGLLLLPKKKRSSKFSRWADIFDEWDRWLDMSGLSAYEACLRFAINQDQVDRVVVGVDSVKQLLELASASAHPLETLPEFTKLKDTRLINPASWIQL